ncbi:MAG: ABC transporter ATP-binding protein [Silvanigrellales bacterium]|nr:ABC transporter ATP-binding protein [Silvanigrellales bacterium]
MDDATHRSGDASPLLPFRSQFVSKSSAAFLGDALAPPFGLAGVRRRLLWTLLCSRKRTLGVAIALGVLATSVGLLAPWFQKSFVDGILQGASARSLAFTMLLAFATMFLSQALLSVTRVVCMRESTLAQKWLSELLYEHTLLLKTGEANPAEGKRSSRTVGETVALYATDVMAACNILDDVVPNLLASLIPLVAAPIAISLVHDVPLWPPVLVSALSVASCLLLSKRQARLFGMMKTFAERRLSIVNEWLQNMRALRVLGWMNAFEQRIFKAREDESVNRLSMVTNGSTMNSIAQVAPFLVNVAGVVSFLSVANVTPTPGDVFSLLWIFGVFLVRPIRMLPWAIVVAVDAQTSAKRLETFFGLPAESHGGANLPAHESAPGGAQCGPLGDASRTPAPWALDVKGLTVTAGERHLLFDVHFRIAKGELVGIIGEVGAGKSLLLQSLLRETRATFRSYQVDGIDALGLSVAKLRTRFGYVPQDSFVMSASLRDNVSFEYGSPEAHEDAVLEALRLADFIPSQERLEGGLATEIGERGVNLSGGQRQRVNLARAHFHKRETLLLDDALSALDTQTESRVRRKLLQGAWKNKTRVLVTHRLSILPHCDRVLFLENGRVAAFGPFHELLANSEGVRAFVKSLSKAEEGRAL